MEPNAKIITENAPTVAHRLKNAARRAIGMQSARSVVSQAVPGRGAHPRAGATYRGFRRNGARTLGRKHPRPTMTFRHPGLANTPHWWTGIRPNAVRHVYAGDPKGKGFTPAEAMARFYFTPAARKAAAAIKSLAGFGRQW
jgi:hypothetical protein